MAYGDRRRLLMVLGKALAGSLSSPSPRLAGAKHVINLRYPVTATFPPALSINGILQARVPSLVSVKRPQFVLRVQMSLPESAQQAVQRATERPRPSGQQVGRKRKAPTPETEVRLAIQMAARENDVDAAFEAYTAAKSLSLKLPLDTYVTVLFLASGGDDWEAEVDRRHATKGSEAAGCGAPKFTKYLDQCQEILESMRAAGHTPNEMCHTAMARREALLGRPDRAFEHAMQVASPDNKSAPRLRCFAPALVGYAVAGKGAEAFSVFAAIDAAGLEPAEAEYRRLLQASALAEPGTGVLWPQIEDVLHRMARELTTLQPTTIEMVKQVFTSPIAAAGSKSSSAGEEQRWVVEACTVSESGDCAAVGERLEAVDLSESEYEEFKRGVAELAARQARQPGDFQTFVKWLETNGPYGAIIDAANVSFYGQNYDAGGFSFAQVGAVVDRLKELHGDLRPLVILHTQRTKNNVAQKQESRDLLARLQAEGNFFATPHGSNDDWYWIYAAVSAGAKGLLVSNDEMRDHIFHMLSPKFFLKWKQRHQMRYSFSGGPSTLVLESPPPYTTCVQQLGKTGAWVFPCVDGSWVCARMVAEAK